MNTILKRNSIRKFDNDFTIPQEDIIEILNRARLTPSGGNVQPWKVISVSGNKLKDLTKILINSAKDGNKCPDIQYYPEGRNQWVSKLNKRRMLTGKGLYEHLSIDRKDDNKRFDMWMDNFRWFDSNNVLFVLMDKKMVDNGEGFLMDCGAFMQSTLIASKELGYGTCPQGSTTEYGELIRKELEIDDDYCLLYSIVLGKPVENELINTYSPERIKVEDFTTFMN